MATLAKQQVSLAGLNPVLAAAAAGGDKFANADQGIVVEVNNPTGGALIITFDDQTSVAPSGAAAFDADVEVSIPAGERRIFGPFARTRFNDATGFVLMTYSAVGLEIAILQT